MDNTTSNNKPSGYGQSMPSLFDNNASIVEFNSDNYVNSRFLDKKPSKSHIPSSPIKPVISDDKAAKQNKSDLLQKMRNNFESLLRSTGRDGIDEVITYLLSSDFFIAPASTAFHSNYDGGLMWHCLRVYKMACMIREDLLSIDPSLEEYLPEDSIIIVTLLHDICKADIYQKATRYRKNIRNEWETYETYTPDYSDFPFGHGEKSVIRLLRLGLHLTRDEMLAIRWHMSAWDLPFQSAEAKSNINEAKTQCPLLSLLQAADGLSSTLLEE